MFVDNYTIADISKIEKEFFESISKDVWCCADMGICNHDAQCIVAARRAIKDYMNGSNR